MNAHAKTPKVSKPAQTAFYRWLRHGRPRTLTVPHNAGKAVVDKLMTVWRAALL